MESSFQIEEDYSFLKYTFRMLGIFLNRLDKSSVMVFITSSYEIVVLSAFGISKLTEIMMVNPILGTIHQGLSFVHVV
jgi:hypothetical protein